MAKVRTRDRLPRRKTQSNSSLNDWVRDNEDKVRHLIATHTGPDQPIVYGARHGGNVVLSIVNRGELARLCPAALQQWARVTPTSFPVILRDGELWDMTILHPSSRHHEMDDLRLIARRCEEQAKQIVRTYALTGQHAGVVIKVTPAGVEVTAYLVETMIEAFNLAPMMDGIQFPAKFTPQHVLMIVWDGNERLHVSVVEEILPSLPKALDPTLN